MELIIKSWGVSLGYSRGAVVVRRRDGVEKVPIHTVDRIWVLTGGVSISSRLVRECARRFIDVVYFDGRGNPVARMFPPEASGVVSHRRAQYEAYLNGKGFELARRVVYGKIANQAAALRRLGSWRREHYEACSAAAAKVAELAPRALSCGDPQCVLGVEGQAAQIYWEALRPILKFPGRDPESADPVNLALNYGYGVLKYAVWRQLVIHGLDPYAGYLHVDKSGRPSLALDLMEEFRPHVDLLIARLKPDETWVEGGLLKREARAKVVEEWAKLGLEKVVARQTALALAHLEGRTTYIPHRL